MHIMLKIVHKSDKSLTDNFQALLRRRQAFWSTASRVSIHENNAIFYRLERFDQFNCVGGECGTASSLLMEVSKPSLHATWPYA